MEPKCFIKLNSNSAPYLLCDCVNYFNSPTPPTFFSGCTMPLGVKAWTANHKKGIFFVRELGIEGKQYEEIYKTTSVSQGEKLGTDFPHSSPKEPTQLTA